MSYDWNQQGDPSRKTTVYLGNSQRKIKKTISDDVMTTGPRRYELHGTRYEVDPETGNSDWPGDFMDLASFARAVAQREMPEGIYGIHITAPDKVGHDACWFAAEGFCIVVKERGGE
jgi:hypothetical protein